MTTIKEATALYMGLDEVLRAFFGSNLVWGEAANTELWLPSHFRENILGWWDASGAAGAPDIENTDSAYDPEFGVWEWRDRSVKNNTMWQNETYGPQPTYFPNGTRGLYFAGDSIKAMVSDDTAWFDDFSCYIVFIRDVGAPTEREILAALEEAENTRWAVGREYNVVANVGGGINETGAPYGRYVPLADGVPHLILTTRIGDKHTISSDGRAVSVTGTASTARI
jgi:hypothetical protein